MKGRGGRSLAMRKNGSVHTPHEQYNGHVESTTSIDKLEGSSLAVGQ